MEATIRKSYHIGENVIVTESTEPDTILVKVGTEEARLTEAEFTALCSLRYSATIRKPEVVE